LLIACQYIFWISFCWALVRVLPFFVIALFWILWLPVEELGRRLGVYHDDGCGIVEQVPNPLGDGMLLLLASKHLAGTKATLLSLFIKPVEISRPNIYGKGVVAHVVEGVGEVDDVVILE